MITETEIITSFYFRVYLIISKLFYSWLRRCLRYRRSNQNLQNITHKTKNRVTRTPTKYRGELMCSGRVAVPAPLVAPVVFF